MVLIWLIRIACMHNTKNNFRNVSAYQISPRLSHDTLSQQGPLILPHLSHVRPTRVKITLIFHSI